MTLFHSKLWQGFTLNRFGVVLEPRSFPASPNMRGLVQQEALAAGWKIVQSENRDEGMIYEPSSQGSPHQDTH